MQARPRSRDPPDVRPHEDASARSTRSSSSRRRSTTTRSRSSLTEAKGRACATSTATSTSTSSAASSPSPSATRNDEGQRRASRRRSTGSATSRRSTRRSPIVELAEKLARIAPGQARSKSFFTASGTEADETAVMLAQICTGRQEIIALRHGYSGRSMLAQSLTAHSTYRARADADRRRSSTRRRRTATAARSRLDVPVAAASSARRTSRS